MKNDPPRNCSECQAFKLGSLSSLGSKAIEDLSQHKVRNTYKKGQNLFIEGSHPFGVFCISSGNIKVTKSGKNGSESIVRIAKIGDFLGDQSLFSGDQYKVTATAIEDTGVCFIDSKHILNIIKKEPTVAMKVIERISKKMGSAEENLSSFHQKNVRERLATLLIQLKEEHSEKELDGRFRITLKLRRDEMATMIGTASETLIRFITEFKQADLIEQVGKTIFIKNLKELEKWARPV
jgi:CRP-like cAMP-binding protein